MAFSVVIFSAVALFQAAKVVRRQNEEDQRKIKQLEKKAIPTKKTQRSNSPHSKTDNAKLNTSSDKPTIPQDIYAIEGRIEKELGIKVQLVGQIDADQVQKDRRSKSEDSMNRSRSSREPSPVGSSARTTIPVRKISAETNTGSLTATPIDRSSGSPSLSKTSDDLLSSSRRNRPEPLKKPDIDPRKIKDYDELRKKRLAMILQAYTGIEDNDNLLGESIKKDVPPAAAPAPAVSSYAAEDQESVSSRVREILARYSTKEQSDNNHAQKSKVAAQQQSKANIRHSDVKSTSSAARVTQPTNTTTAQQRVPYYMQARRQAYPHKKNYRQTGSSTHESETESEIERTVYDSKKYTSTPGAPMHNDVLSDTDEEVARHINNAPHKHQARKSLASQSKKSHQARTPSSERASSAERSSPERKSSTERAPNARTSRKVSPKPKRSQNAPKHERSPSPRQTNLNYSALRYTTRDPPPSQYTNEFDSTDNYESDSLSHQRRLPSVSPSYPSPLKPVHSNTNDYSTSLNESFRDSVDLESRPYPERTPNDDKRTHRHVSPSYFSSSRNAPVPKIKDLKTQYHTWLRESNDNLRPAGGRPGTPGNEYESDSKDTAELIAKYTSSRKPSDVSSASDSEFVVTRDGDLHKVRKPSSAGSAPWSARSQGSIRSSQYSDDRLNEEVAQATMSLERNDDYWKEPKLYDYRYGTPTPPPSTSPHLSPRTDPLDDRSSLPYPSEDIASVRASTFPWHSNKTFDDDLSNSNVTDEEKRRQASSYMSSRYRDSYRSSSLRTPLSPRTASLTRSSSASPSRLSSSLLTPPSTSRYSGSGLRSSSVGSRHSATVPLPSYGLPTTSSSSLYQRPSDSLTRHTVSSSLKTSASRAHQV